MGPSPPISKVCPSGLNARAVTRLSGAAIEPSKAPDFADCVAIFDKIGTDSCELFLKPGLSGKLHFARRLAQLALRLKVPFDIIDTDDANVRGARRIARDDPQRGAACISSWNLGRSASVPMQDVKSLVLARMFD